MRILYPDRVDVPSPHATIYRKIAAMLPHDAFAFAEKGYDPKLDDEVNIIELGDEIHDKILGYLREYIGEYDIVHTGPVFHVLATIPLKPVSNTKVVHTIHNAEERSEQFEHRNRIRRRLMVRTADQVTVVSRFLRDHVAEVYHRRAAVVPNGVDLDAFSPDTAQTKTSTCLFVGRLVERKHPEFVLDLARALPSVDFKMVGRGPLSHSIAADIGSLDNVEHFPWVDQPDLERLYAEAGVTLCPFEREAFGMVLVESMSSGTPVLGLDRGNVSHLVQPGRNGLLCDNLSVEEWIDGIETVLSGMYRFSPRETVERYSWDRIARKYERVYEQTVSD